MTRAKTSGGWLSSSLGQLVGAAAGVVVLLSLLGSLASWERFDTLDLPNYAAVATLSQTTLLIQGATLLATPLGLGLVAVAASLPARRLVPWPWWWVETHVLAIAAGAAIAAGTAIAAVFWPWYDALYIGCAGLLVLVSLTGPFRRLSTPVVAYTLFFSMVAIGTIVGAVQIVRPPTHLERTTLVFSDGQPLYGFLIAATSDTVYIAPQVGGRYGPCQVERYIVAYHRAKLAGIFFEPRVNVWPRDEKRAPDPCELDEEADRALRRALAEPRR